jgi:hypothetical protein
MHHPNDSFFITQKFCLAEGKVLGALHASINPWKMMNLHFLIHRANYIENFILPYAWFWKFSKRSKKFYLALVVTYHSIYMMTFYFSFQYLISHALLLYNWTLAHTRLTEWFITHTLFITYVLEPRAEDHVSAGFWSIVSIFWDLYYITCLKVKLVHLRLLYFEECTSTLYFTLLPFTLMMLLSI